MPSVSKLDKVKSVSAFANGEGGSLFFGVDNNHVVRGLKDVTYDVMNELTDRQRAIVTMARVNPYVTGVEMSRMLHVSERTIRRDLSEMKHIMVHEGDRNDGKWVL